MLDVSLTYYRYGFLGGEFLTWLWFYIVNNDQNELFDNKKVFLEIGNKIVLERKANDAVEKVTINGKDAGLEEGIISLKKGAVVKELNLLYRKEDKEWSFTITGESLGISNLKVPDIGFIESKKDVAGFVVEKVFLYDSLYQLTDGLYKKFIKLRVSNGWVTVVSDMNKWINS
ncbi:MAG: hypothetical protein EHM85_03860 [Desulfobacteraceae bacterium]|nr:MAG: hypothetical protein EHM85_03860 [Desulfobacteraceae bacterium]